MHRCFFAELQNFVEEFFDGIGVVLNGLLGQQLARFIFARRVADHARDAADQHDGLMAAFLEPPHHQVGDHMADMQAFARGVDAAISGDFFGTEQLIQPLQVGALVQKPAFLHDFQEF